MPEKQARTPENVRVVSEEIRRRTADLVAAYNAANVNDTLSYFAPGAIYMPPDRPAMHGLEAMRDHLSLAFVTRVELVILTREAFASSGEIVMQRGHYHRRVALGGHNTLDQHGTYEATWRVQTDGDYRVTSLIFGHASIAPNGHRP
jgi:ketosteroid isomerase-like protein